MFVQHFYYVLLKEIWIKGQVDEEVKRKRTYLFESHNKEKVKGNETRN